jgi:hypothetical protein
MYTGLILEGPRAGETVTNKSKHYMCEALMTFRNSPVNAAEVMQAMDAQVKVYEYKFLVSHFYGADAKQNGELGFWLLIGGAIKTHYDVFSFLARAYPQSKACYQERNKSR